MTPAHPFSAKLVIGLIAAGVVSFIAFMLLMAYGGGLGSGRDGRAHANSVAATGFKGLVALMDDLGETRLVQNPADLDTEDLVVVALEPQTRPELVEQLLARREARVTLLILPKWWTRPHPSASGWVQIQGSGLGNNIEHLLGPSIEVETGSRREGEVASGESFLEGVEFPVPLSPQTISGKNVQPLIATAEGEALVAQIGDRPLFVVADPDLLNNHGLRDARTARGANALIRGLNSSDAEAVHFDLTLNGFGTGQAPGMLRLAFEPPFVVMTLALLAAALLAGIQGAFRFGPVRREERAIAFGKAALVENSAALIRLAGREANLGGDYADMVRQQAARETGAPATLRDDELDKYLNRFARPGAPAFTELTARLRLARGRNELIAAARALFQWKKETIR